ncbi:MAG: tetratricopeptide repeat protein [Myxococcaceae bacterium]|nr:tetratricopeptide repeat protein [Myxococcaceae bacterium]
MEHVENELLARHVANSLRPEEHARVASHLDGCVQCRRSFAEAQALALARTHVSPPSLSQGSGVPTRSDAPLADASNGSLAKGTSLGRYVLLERLGAGGMGEVFAAYDPHLDRKVALKLLRNGSVSADEGRARLVREAQAMARLNHPNVATVHDVGTFEDRVFIAMEFVEGETLGEWMRGARPWEEVIKLFLRAGSGLAAAHHAGIVHRDFKPDNVLIGDDNRPRVVDFGLARQAVSREKTPSSSPHGPVSESALDTTSLGSPITRDGAVMGTPGYMAPEQLAGLPTDARSDQFSFCVALFEALYGQRPFGGDTLRSHEEAIRAGHIFAPPSTTVIPAQIYQALKRGLSADAAARFLSMDELLQALRPPAPFVVPKRLRWVMGVLGVLAVAAVGFGAYSANRVKVCGGFDARLNNVWDSTTQKNLADAFMGTGLPYAADAWKGAQRPLDAYAKDWVKGATATCQAAHIRKTDPEEIFKLKSLCLESRLQDFTALVRVFEKPDRDVVTQAPQAARLLEPISACLDAVALSAVERPTVSATPETVANVRALLSQARAQYAAGKYALGVELAAQAATRDSYPALKAEAFLLLGRLQWRAGMAEEALKSLYEATLAAQSSGDAALQALSFSRLFVAHAARSGHDERAHQWEALARAAARRVPKDLELESELASDSGQVALADGRYEAALASFQRALALKKQLRGEEDPEVASTLANVGTALARLLRIPEAIAVYEDALNLQLRSLGPDHPNTAQSMNNLAVIYRREGRLAEALTLTERALAVREKVLGAEHPEVATSYLGLGNLQLRLGSYDLAMKNLQRALEIRQKAAGPESGPVAAVYDDIAAAYASHGHWKESLDAAQMSLSITEKQLGPAHPNTAGANEAVGLAYVRLGQWAKAEAALNRALTLRVAQAGAKQNEDANVARSIAALGDMELAQNHGERALAYFQRALEIRTRIDGPLPSSAAKEYMGIGQALMLQKLPGRAATAFEQALKLRQPSEDTAELGRNELWLAMSLWDVGPEHRARAVSLAQSAKTHLPVVAKEEAQRWLDKHVLSEKK